MSRKRQGAFTPQRPVAAFALELQQGSSTGWHTHPFGQLLHASSGVMRVTTHAGAWVVPPLRAVWIPTGVDHEVAMVTSVSLRTVYVVDGARDGMPPTTCVVAVSPLLRELILAALELPRPYPLGGAEERLFNVLLDAMTFHEVLPLHLPMPSQPNALTVARGLIKEPGDQRTLAEWGIETGYSARTLARAFRDDTGLTFGGWRAQLRLTRSLELLAQRKPVTEVALTLGYDSLSAFVNRFRRHLGTTPTRYFSSEPGRRPR